MSLLKHHKNMIQKLLIELESSPNSIELLFKIADIYYDDNKLDDAEIYYKKIISLDENNFIAYVSLGNIYKIKNMLTLALNLYNKAKKIAPNYPNVYYNLALLYQNIDNFKLAKENYLKTIQLHTEHYPALTNLASIYIDTNKLNRALELLHKALNIKNIYKINHNIYTIYMKLNKYKEAYKYRGYRYDKNWSRYAPDDLNYKLKKNHDIKDKIIYIYSEQGYGDIMQLVRFIPAFYKAKILFYVKMELRKLLKLNYPKIIFLEDIIREKVHYHFSIIDSPELLNMSYEQIPFGSGYLKVDKEDSKFFYNNYFKNEKKLKIGIVWRSNNLKIETDTKAKERFQRNTTLDQFLKYFKNNNIKLYSLQVNTTNEEKELLKQNDILSLGDDFIDFYDNALVIDNLDLVIGIDTTSIQLSGAMGKPTIVLVPFSCDWRWGVEGKKTNWYNSITICRQKAIGDWDSAFIEAKEELDEFISNNPRTQHQMIK